MSISTTPKNQSSFKYTTINDEEISEDEDIRLKQTIVSAEKDRRHSTTLKRIQQDKEDLQQSQEISDKLFGLLKSSNVSELTVYLQENPRIFVCDIVDSEGDSLLHYATFNNKEECAIYLVKHAIATLTK